MPFRWRQNGPEILTPSLSIELEVGDIDKFSRSVTSYARKRGKQGDVAVICIIYTSLVTSGSHRSEKLNYADIMGIYAPHRHRRGQNVRTK